MNPDPKAMFDHLIMKSLNIQFFFSEVYKLDFTNSILYRNTIHYGLKWETPKIKVRLSVTSPPNHYSSTPFPQLSVHTVCSGSIVEYLYYSHKLTLLPGYTVGNSHLSKEILKIMKISSFLVFSDHFKEKADFGLEIKKIPPGSATLNNKM